MPYCSIEEAWKETLIDKKTDTLTNIPLIKRSEANMNEVIEANKEDSSSLPVIEYAKYSNPDYHTKLQKILKENILLKERIRELDSRSKTTTNKYLINLFLYIFTGVIVLLILDNLPKYNSIPLRTYY